MKRLLKPLLLLLTVCTIASCSSDDDGGSLDVDNAGSGTFFAKVNGEDFNPDFKTAFYSSSIDNITVTGSMPDGEQIQLFVNSNAAPGTYSLNDPTSFIIAYYQFEDGDAFDVAAFAETGSVTIETMDSSSKRIKGTFNFSGMVVNTGASFTVTEGRFDLNWTDL